MNLFRRMVETLLWPRRLASAVEASTQLRDGAQPAMLAAAIWALFCLVLQRAGHAPTVTLMAIPRHRYYLFQAAVLVPLLVAMWWFMFRIIAHFGPVDAKVYTPFAVFLGYAYSVPLLAAFILPDILVFGLVGHAQMGKWLPYYAWIAPVWTISLCAFGLVVIGGSTRARAIGVSLLAYLMQALVSGAVLRCHLLVRRCQVVVLGPALLWPSRLARGFRRPGGER